MKNKDFILGMISILLMSGLTAQDTHKVQRNIYVVRHAEKDSGNNPVLSAEGRQRAGDLYRTLKNKKIDLIFVSQYRRTALTADSLRIRQNIDTVHYKADASGDDLFEMLDEKATGATNILIVGHSNTIPAIVRRAGAQDYTTKELDENEYDKLFIVTHKKNKTSLKIKKYGKASAEKAADAKMNILQ